MFVTGLSQGNDHDIYVPDQILRKDLSVLHLLLKSQNKCVTSSQLKNYKVINVRVTPLSSHNTYVLGYYISQSQFQWYLCVGDVDDEHAKMMKVALTT